MLAIRSDAIKASGQLGIAEGRGDACFVGKEALVGC